MKIKFYKIDKYLLDKWTGQKKQSKIRGKDYQPFMNECF